MRKLNKRAGFTLAELLIVVAIIAILVAIGIPAFSTAMERSRETVDLANIRGAYAEFMAGALGGKVNEGYYKVTIKQRECDKDWIIDCSGFLSNVADKKGKAITKMPNNKTTGDEAGEGWSEFKTGDVWVVFTNYENNEKPTLSFAKYTAPGTTKPSNLKDANPTQGISLQSGDGWWLGTHSGV